MKRLVNAITCTRFVIALILVLAAPSSAWFWAAYGLGAVSDVLDGLLARRFGVQSDGGARLDSAADIAFLLDSRRRCCARGSWRAGCCTRRAQCCSSVV